MKRAASEADAKMARDLSIECMALLNRTVFHARESCPEDFFIAYRRACGNLMGEFGEIINRAAYDYPALKPSEDEWNQVASSRVREDELPASDKVGREEMRQMLLRVRMRAAEVQTLTPRMMGDEGVVSAALDAVDGLIAQWRVI